MAEEAKKLKCDNCGEIDYVLVDGYDFGDRLLEGVMFEIRIVKGKYKAQVKKDCASYFDDLNTKKWLSECEFYAEELDVATCPKCDGEIGMPNDS